MWPFKPGDINGRPLCLITTVLRGEGVPPLFRQRLRTPFSEMMELVRSRGALLDFSASSSVVESWEKRLVT